MLLLYTVRPDRRSPVQSSPVQSRPQGLGELLPGRFDSEHFNSQSGVLALSWIKGFNKTNQCLNKHNSVVNNNWIGSYNNWVSVSQRPQPSHHAPVLSMCGNSSLLMSCGFHTLTGSSPNKDLTIIKQRDVKQTETQRWELRAINNSNGTSSVSAVSWPAQSQHHILFLRPCGIRLVEDVVELQRYSFWKTLIEQQRHATTAWAERLQPFHVKGWRLARVFVPWSSSTCFCLKWQIR